VTENTIIYQNASIFYRSIGVGKPVVLIHGFAEDGEIWNNQLDFLKDHFRLIVPDLPGSGQSELLPNANIETYAEIIKQIIDVELQKSFIPEVEESTLTAKNTGTFAWESDGLVTIIGHSLGGYITLAFAEKYPQYLRSFGLFHSTAFADTEEKKQVRLKAIDFINDNGANAFLKTSIPGLFTKAFAEKFPEKITGLVERGKNFTAAALVQYYHAMIERPDRTMVLRDNRLPILFIIGEFDTAIPLQSSLQQCHIPAESHVHILNQSAHMGMWEETGKSNQALHTFLS